MKKETFIFRTEWIQYFDMLDSDDLGRCLHIIKDYVEKNEEPKKPNLSDRLLMVWTFIKNQLDKDLTKYDKRCETSKENGKKGGRPKKEENLKNLKNPEKHDNDYEYDYDNDYDNDNKEVLVVDIYTFIEKNFGRTLSPIEYEEISTWEDTELTRYAITQAVLNSICNIKYISRIIENYKIKNIKTVLQAQQDEKKYKEGQELKKKNYKQNNIQKVSPEWVDKTIHEEQATDEEIKKLEERLNRR